MVNRYKAWLFAVCMSTPLFIWYQVNHKTGELDSGLSQFVMMEEVMILYILQ